MEDEEEEINVQVRGTVNALLFNAGELLGQNVYIKYTNSACFVTYEGQGGKIKVTYKFTVQRVQKFLNIWKFWL